MNILFRRWLPAARYIPKRNAILAIAGLAIVGTGLALPTLTRTQEAAAAEQPLVAARVAGAAAPTAVTSTAPNVAEATQATPATGATKAPPAAAATTAPVAPASPAPPFEKALVPDFQLQPNGYYCGPAATRLAITAHGQAAPSQDDLASMLGTTENGTNSAEDTTRVLNQILGAGIYQTHVISPYAATPAETDLLRVNIVHAISGGYAAVANVVGGATDLSGGWHEYDGGHYVSVVGYGKGGLTMKIADPADTQGDGTYWVNTLDLANWMASRGYSA